MLPKKYRIDKKLLEEVVKKGKKISSQHLFAKTLVIDRENPLFGIIVLSGVAPNAVTRNKIKRRARNIVLKIIPRIKRELAGVIFLGKGCEKLTFKELEKEINDIFNIQ